LSTQFCLAVDSNHFHLPIFYMHSLETFHAEAFADLYGEDGLLVMGKGLGWLSLLAVFVRFYADTDEGYVSLLEPGSVTATSELYLI